MQNKLHKSIYKEFVYCDPNDHLMKTDNKLTRPKHNCKHLCNNHLCNGCNNNSNDSQKVITIQSDITGHYSGASAIGCNNVTQNINTSPNTSPGLELNNNPKNKPKDIKKEEHKQIIYDEDTFNQIELRGFITKELLKQSLESIGGAKLMNIHMGTAVSQDRAVMTDILSFCKEKSITFLDSRTIENTVSKEVGDSLNTKVLERDIFLEVNSRPSVHFAKQRIAEAIELCKQKGSVIVIGHVGPVGTNQTAQAIKESIETIKNAGIQIVPLSQI